MHPRVPDGAGVAFGVWYPPQALTDGKLSEP